MRRRINDTVLSPVTARRDAFRLSDPEEFGASAPRGTQHQMVLRSRGAYEAWRWRSASSVMIASRGRTKLAVTHRTGTGRFAFFTFVAHDDPPSVMHGRSLQPGTLAWCRAETEIYSQSPVGATWSNLCFPVEAVQQDWEALFGTSFNGPREPVEVVPLSVNVQRQLEAGLDAAIAASEHAPTLVHGLLRLLLEAFVNHRGAAPAGRPQTRPGLARQIRVVDGLVAIADGADGNCPLASVCAQLGVPLRTLNSSSNALLGMGAGQYLRRRRMQRVQALLHRGEMNVTDAATSQGFWDLGRFAVDYRTLFGVSPSTSLRSSAAREAARQRRPPSARSADGG